MRDIDYAAVTVHKQISEKFSRLQDLAALEVRAEETVIVVEDGDRCLRGTRDHLLAALRKSASYEDFFATVLPGQLVRD